MKNKEKIKELGDANLINKISELQIYLSNQRILNQTTVDLSEENRILDLILHAKYHFLYDEAKYRHARSKYSNSVIAQ